MSEGGGVFPRDAKWIELPERARELLGLDDERAAPNDVIRAILRAPVDLLWNGGIGTVVKASTETDADAHDRASDAIRVDARDLRARVVGEGGNLGFTRRARVEYAAGGGRINADFIDNSAGVDCSDHEVNLKILLGLAERRGEMTRAERDELLEAVTEDVVAHVLYDSFLQAQIIAQEVERSAGRMFAYEDLVRAARGDRAARPRVRGPADNEEIAERRRGGRGMERPELAILVAYSKRWVARALEAQRLRRRPVARARPARATSRAAVVERCGHLLGEHPLRTQLICMINANSVVNALGPTFVSQLVAERGADVAEVVRAFRIALRGHRRRPRCGRRSSGSRASSRAAQLELLGGVDALVEATARWYLTWAPGAPLEETIAAGRDGFERLAAVLAELGTEERRRGASRRSSSGCSAEGVPERRRAAPTRCAAELVHAPDMVAVAAATEPLDRGRRAASSSRSAPSCGWTGWSASSPACGRRRGCSGGRCRPCARTRSRPGASWPRRRCARAPGAEPLVGGRALPARATRRRLGAPGGVPARAGARGRARPRRPDARRPPAARAGLVAPTITRSARTGAAAARPAPSRRAGSRSATAA